ncbi:Acetyltransferase (GNAT) family protein [Paenibacillus polysaccharolyticus]|uniref:Acetyltransferase (GNAT) family protein n=1 Tax=Paenibacillus polysaccharolyticus TaxID=582692 RepID=A0A1G5KJR5_9BACL|nr:GNAT family N-acetyltransferase [Paenibacillus polysaccharolyticus]SCZ00330.1 Acetyltransferase (GNAT) family protein [Paenibacillus polysaccharolyticus]
MKIVESQQIPVTLRSNFFVEHWGSPKMAISTGVYHIDKLNGYAVLNEVGGIRGYITYVMHEDRCEVISLDSLDENQGIGSALLAKVEDTARQAKRNQIQLITTNDNLHALLFYQKKGYQIIRIIPDAVAKARALKPSIPLVSEQGIPIRDELLLQKILVLNS